MNDWLPTILLAIGATNPPTVAALAHALPKRHRLGAAATTAAIGIALALVGEQVVDLLDVTLGTYRLGAALVVLLASAAALLRGMPEPLPGKGVVVPGVFPAYARPGRLVVAVSAGAVDRGMAVVAVLVSIALCGRGRRLPDSAIAGGARLAGALGIVMGIALGVDGIKSL